MNLGKISFDGDCDTLNDGEIPQWICADVGPVLATFVTVFVVVLGLLSCGNGLVMMGRQSSRSVGPLPRRF